MNETILAKFFLRNILAKLNLTQYFVYKYILENFGKKKSQLNHFKTKKFFISKLLSNICHLNIIDSFKNLTKIFLFLQKKSLQSQKLIEAHKYEELPINLVTSSELDFFRKQILENESNIKRYCLRSVENQTEIYNENTLDCSITFTANKNICIMGVQVPSQLFHRVRFKNSNIIRNVNM